MKPAVVAAVNQPPCPDGQARISVVIPCFNYARYVGGAIESALSQAYPHKQIVVVNDGSTDDSLQVIDRYADRVEIIDQPNQGSVAAYNHGFAATTGDLVIFLDADDLLAPGALDAVAAVWRAGCAKVQYDLGIIDSNGEDLGRRFCNFDAAYDSRRVRSAFRRTGTYRWPVTAGNAYARWFVAPIFPLSIDHGPDGTLNTVAPVYGDVVTIPRVLGWYRIHGANMWTSDGLDQSRLPYRIAHRRREIDFMRTHAARNQVAVTAGDVLDHELPFLNYRLMALKLGLDYPGRSADSIPALVGHARRAVAAEHLPPALAAAHLAWFLALAVAPRRMAVAMIRLRFGRGTLLRSMRRALGAVRGLRPAAGGAP